MTAPESVPWLQKVQRLDELCDRLMFAMVALRGAKPEDRVTLGNVVVELRFIVTELECLRNATD